MKLPDAGGINSRRQGFLSAFRQLSLAELYIDDVIEADDLVVRDSRKTLRLFEVMEWISEFDVHSHLQS